MTKHAVSLYYPGLIDDQKFSRNGMVPDCIVSKRLAEGFNIVSCRNKKQVLMKCQLLRTVDAGAAFINLLWPFAFCTGENTTGLTVSVGQALLDGGAGGSGAFYLYPLTYAGAEVPTISLDFNGVTDTTDVGPGDIHHGVFAVTGLTPNTEYRGSFAEVAGARIVYASVVETAGPIASAMLADDTVAAVCNPGGYVAEAPIYATHTADLIGANNALWRHNGSHLLHWSEDVFATFGSPDSPTVTATTYTNVMDGTTSVSSSSAGVNMFTQYHNTVNRTTVPVRMAVRATGAGSLSVRVTDGTNSVALTGITSGGPGEWYTVTGTMPPQAGTKWDIQAKVASGGDTFQLDAVSLWEYET